MNNTPDTFTSAAEQDMSETRQAFLTGERAEFFAHDRRYVDTIFDDGESPLKHAHDIELSARIMSDRTGRPVAAKIFSASAPADRTADGKAAESLDAALASVLRQMVNWTAAAI